MFFFSPIYKSSKKCSFFLQFTNRVKKVKIIHMIFYFLSKLKPQDLNQNVEFYEISQ